MIERQWSWAPDRAGVEERLNVASRLNGSRLRAVRYFDIDYGRGTLAPHWRGPRQVVDEDEWKDPSWRFPDCDSIDYGLELETESGRIFSVTWDSPGEREGVGIDEVPLIGSGFQDDADVAVWDVRDRSRWHGFIGQEIVAVQPRYRSWPPSGFWCSRIAVQFSQGCVELLLAQEHPGGEIEPAGDNVAVLFPPTPLPYWERDESRV